MRYYGRCAKKLTLYEAAVLAGLLKAPSRYSPSSNARLADQRARLVLNKMVEAGFISRKAVTAALALACPPLETTCRGSVRYFTDCVFDTLQQKVDVADQDLEVRTTLDLQLQTLAETQAAVAMATQRWQAEQISLVSMTPQGVVKAMIGGLHYDNSQFNRATQAL